ncbi:MULTISPECIES: cation diffusion facilitator family transporter [Paenibacillus]|uniref:cation diffusion facilitator family transporter n=1 Tax=Paenibacillus TaxID=44249 RepID=UPI0022B89F00|nr:cation diffusion facilitator family transporter [Paenibacillus caseinilyticus]MCZ8519048.1 cation diffusion facilitator family transporter [Paenibacillus caseinilyticus]
MTDERDRQAEAPVRIAIVSTLALAVLKAAAGMAAGSKALIADGLHSAAGALCSLAALLGSQAGGRQERIRTVSGVVLSVLLLVMGIEIGVSSLRTIYSGEVEAPGPYALIVLIVSVFASESLYQYGLRTASGPGTNLPRAAGMRERRSGRYTAIAAFTGIAGAQLGDYLGNKYAAYLDPAAGIVIAFFVLRMGYLAVVDSLSGRTAKVLEQEDAADLLETVQRVKGVIAVDALQAKEQGHYVTVDVQISVNPRITIQEGSEIARIVKQTLMKRFSHVTDVHTQVNPYDPGYPYKSAGREQDEIPTLLH